MPFLLILPSLVLAAGIYLLPPRIRARGLSFDSPEGDAPADATGSALRLEPPVAGPPTVSVIVPALNEAESIGWVLEHIPAWVSEVVLVDGLSNDQTEAIARELRPDIVVVHQHRRGKGAALRAGFAAASGDIVVMIDADGSTDPTEMHLFVERLEAGADFVKGSRHLAGGGSLDFTAIRRAGNRSFVLLANLLYGSHFTDLCYGYCAFWRRHLDALALTADGFEIETQLVLNAVKAGLSIAEVPSVELERRAGSSNLNAVKDGRRILTTMLSERRSGLDRRGGQDRRRAQLDLIEVGVAADHSRVVLTDGQDRRRSDRRAARVSALDGRRGDRRQPGARPSATIYQAVNRGDGTVVLARQPDPGGWRGFTRPLVGGQSVVHLDPEADGVATAASRPEAMALAVGNDR